MKPVPDWIMFILAYIAGIAILLGLFSTMTMWPMFHVLGD